MSISCVTVSFILEANNAACSSNLGMVVSLFLIGAIFDFSRTRVQCFELVFITLTYAAAPYALLEASGNMCNSTFFVSVDLKLIHLGTANDDDFKTKLLISSTDQLSLSAILRPTLDSFSRFLGSKVLPLQ